MKTAPPRPLCRYLKGFLLLAACLVWAVAPTRAAFAHLVFVANYRMAPATDAMQTEVYLRFAGEHLFFSQTENGCRAVVEIAIEFRRPDGKTVKAARYRHFFQETENEIFYVVRKPFRAPAGEYTLWIEAIDTETQERAVQQLPCLVTKFTGQTALSGILLLQNHNGKSRPYVSNYLPPALPAANYDFTVFSPEEKPVTFRSILFRKESQAANSPAQKYVSISQTARAVRLKKGLQTQRQTLNLEGLEAGEYLLEVYALDDDRVAALASQTFVLEWEGLAGVLDRLDESIQAMRCLLPDKTIDEWLQIPDPAEKRRLFLQRWRLLNPNPADYPFAALVNYYRKVEEANRMFGGWQTDRAKIALRYGLPDVVENLPNHKICWRYRHFNLKFVFIPQGESYRLASL